MRKIIHVDMDCFFAAVEMRDNPALRDIPVIMMSGNEQAMEQFESEGYAAQSQEIVDSLNALLNK